MKSVQVWGVRCALGLAALALGCSAQPTKAAGAATGDYVVAALPETVQNRTLVDFASRLHLVGYDVASSDTARPGSKLRLTLYWERVGDLEPGWRLSTELVSGTTGRALPASGALRGGSVDPSAWQLGKVYVDQHEVTLPKDIRAPSVTLAASVVREAPAIEAPAKEGKDAKDAKDAKDDAVVPDLYLPVVSGLSDGHGHAILARLATGVNPNAPAPSAAAPDAVRPLQPPRLDNAARVPLAMPRPTASVLIAPH